MVRTSLACVVVAAASLTLLAQPQNPPQQPPPVSQQPPTFRGGATTVPVYVTVNDRNGGFVLGLKKDDFEVRDNGKLQEVTQFATDAQPLSSVILIDGSGSMLPVFKSVIDAANSFIFRMLPADRTAIASFADRFQMRQPFTSNRDELLAHLKDEFNIRVANETRLWEALTDSVAALTKEQGRRVVLVMTDGKQWMAPAALPSNTRPTLGSFQTGPQLTAPPRELLTYALDLDVMIYALAMWTQTDGVQERPASGIMQLATETGGGFVELKQADDMGVTMTQIANELHQQYVLGFTPQVLDGKSHKLDVKLKRPGVTIRSRKSYTAPKG